jgi:inorganic pyrophosphatase
MKPAALDRLPTRDDEGHYLAVIEAALGSRNKCKFDPKLGAMVLHKVLPLGATFPYCFGFIPSTRAADGDPIDVLVFMDEPVAPGVVVPCRIVGIIEAEQTEGRKTIRNDRVLAVAAKSKQYEDHRALSDFPDKVLEGIEHFFVFYNRESGKTFTPLGRHGRVVAERAIARTARKRR